MPVFVRRPRHHDARHREHSRRRQGVEPRLRQDEEARVRQGGEREVVRVTGKGRQITVEAARARGLHLPIVAAREDHGRPRPQRRPEPPRDDQSYSRRGIAGVPSSRRTILRTRIYCLDVKIGHYTCGKKFTLDV